LKWLEISLGGIGGMQEYELPNESKFLSKMIQILENGSESHRQLATILKQSTLGFDPSSQFTRRKWNYFWLDIKIMAPFKYNKILQKSENKSILVDIAEQLLPLDCG
jgi:hypothetical protein